MKTRPSGEQQITDGAKTIGLSAITSAFQSGGQLGGLGPAATELGGFGAAVGELGSIGAAVGELGSFGAAVAAQAQNASKAAQSRILAAAAGFIKKFVA
jgi:hypothetical protein